MAAARQSATRNEHHLSRFSSGKVYRGSRKRLRGIKWQEHTPVGFWIFVVLVLVLLVIVIRLQVTG